MLRSLPLLVVLALVLAPSSSPASLFLVLEGEIQGDIPGDALFAPEAGTIAVEDYDHRTEYFLDEVTGQPASRRLSSGVTFTKQRDPATVPMLRALGENETFVVCEFRKYELDESGALVLTRRIRLGGAFLIQQASTTDESGQALERWELQYTSMEVFDDVNGDSFLDREPSAAE